MGGVRSCVVCLLLAASASGCVEPTDGGGAPRADAAPASEGGPGRAEGGSPSRDAAPDGPASDASGGSDANLSDTGAPDASSADGGEAGSPDAAGDADATGDAGSPDAASDASADASPSEAGADAAGDASAEGGAGLCAGVVCTALDACHAAGVCNPSSGLCSNPPAADGTTCDDGNPAVPVDACMAGVCTPRPASCREVQLAAGGAVGDGVYTLYRPDGTPRSAYCDMTSEGGGWTALFVGANGSPNVFDHFDAPVYTGAFTDPTSLRYLQRVPAELGRSAAELSVSCGGAAVKFAVTEPVRKWLFDGVQADWQDLTPTVLGGSFPNVPNGLYTGNGTNYGFIFAKNRSALGNTFASSFSGSSSYDYCANGASTTDVVRVSYREVTPPPTRNTPATARASCNAILAAGDSHGDGLYYLAPDGASPYLAYCDMTSDGGGWTAVLATRNGSANVIGHVDDDPFTAYCPDASSRCVRRAPASLGNTATQIGVACGGSMVRFPMTEQARRWLVSGQRQSWIDVTTTVIAGAFANVPNTLWTGSSGTDESFVLARNRASLGNTFASSYANNTSYDYCANQPDAASVVRVMYREAQPAPVLNTTATALATCRALRAAGSTVSGVYHLTQAGGGTYLAFCDMASDGGGWTTLFTGRNGSPNVFDHFDASYQGVCTDPATRCLRRAPALLADSATELGVSCGNAMVRFATTEQARKFLVNGLQQSWIALTPTVVTGSFANVPNGLWTGSNATERGFIFARNEASLGNTFGASYATNTTFDYCANALDQSSPLRVAFREATPTTVVNTAATAGASCRALQRGGSTASGIYHLADGAGGTLLAYCDMTTAGGGWTTLFAGRNGSVNVFDHFDAGYVGECPDPATRCLRRARSTLGDSATELLVGCGAAQVSFALTEQARRFLVTGTRQDWIDLTPSVIGGSFANVPNTFFTGNGADGGFIVARNRSALGNTFASSFATNTSFDYCANAQDQASLVRMAVREVDPEPVRNAPAGALPSCLALRTGGATSSGVYWLAEPSGAPYEAYCDMTTDGGGWTAVFAGRNGSVNVFDRFGTGYAGTCTDPATHCVRRAPASASSATELSVSCSDAVVKFAMTPTALAYLSFGTQAGWTALAPVVLAGSFANVPNGMYTGNGAEGGFIFARNQSALGNAFASSFATDATFDYCANGKDQASLVRVFYR